jgi:pantothenate kinase
MKVEPELVTAILKKVEQLAPQQRYLLGIVGFPGAGKSTFSAKLAAKINQKAKEEMAIVVPMDGFHRFNAELKAWGIWELKGIPESFDADAFILLLQALQEQTHRTIGCPTFDRTIEEPTENGIFVEPKHRLVIVEGNYLLLANSPWNKIKGLLSETWYIEETLTAIKPRLLERHMKGGRNKKQALKKMESTDLANARLIKVTRPLADRIIRLS